MKTGIYITVMLVIIVLLAKVLSPGSFLEAERYELDISEKALMQIIHEFKNEHKEFCVPDSLNIKDGRENADDLWYNIYFYFPKDTTIMYAWIRQVEYRTTTIALVSVKLNDGMPEWKIINRDFSSSDNKKQKGRFEKQIILPLKKIISKKES
ncbi:MAG: hypothetical protein JNL13_08555 [Chitinophagaceae bacterium]|nr:hypothetical protein [Chitinophagaceae bacterium]